MCLRTPGFATRQWLDAGSSCLIVFKGHAGLAAHACACARTCVSLVMSSASAAAANAPSDGSMCGRSVLGSETRSMSKKRLPGMREALNSSLGFLPACKCQTCHGSVLFFTTR